MAGRREHKIGTATQGMGRALGDRKKKKREKGVLAVINSPFFFSGLSDLVGATGETSARTPPVTDRFPAPRSSTHTSSPIMPQHPTSPPSDCASTHSVSTDADTRTYGHTVMMVNRPSLEKYNFEDSGPAKVADSTRTHMAAVNKPNRKAAPTSSIRTAKLHSHAHVTRTHSHTHTRIYTHPHRTRKKERRRQGKGDKREKKKEQKEEDGGE